MPFTMTKLETLTSDIEAAQKRIQDGAEAAFKDAFKSFFKAHPEVEHLTWTQYSPHFNDGDPCTFSRHDIGVRLVPAARAIVLAGKKLDEDFADAPIDTAREEAVEDDEEDDYEGGDLKYFDLKPNVEGIKPYADAKDWQGRPASYANDVPAFVECNRRRTTFEKTLLEDVKAIDKIDETLFETAFGDGVRVTVTREGIDVTEYDHD